MHGKKWEMPTDYWSVMSGFNPNDVKRVVELNHVFMSVVGTTGRGSQINRGRGGMTGRCAEAKHSVELEAAGIKTSGVLWAQP